MSGSKLLNFKKSKMGREKCEPVICVSFELVVDGLRFCDSSPVTSGKDSDNAVNPQNQQLTYHLEVFLTSTLGVILIM